MKYVVVIPESYQMNREYRLANPEFETHREAVANALAISGVCGKAVEIQRYPKPYDRTEMVLRG